MLNITKDNVLELLKTAVDSKGEDFVYNVDNPNARCFYVPTPEFVNAVSSGSYFFTRIPKEALDPQNPKAQTGCLIGTMLVLNGLDVESSPAGYEILRKGTSNVHALLNELREAGLVEFDAASREALLAAQEMQDQGGTWGGAYLVAEHYMERNRKLVRHDNEETNSVDL